MKDYLSSVQEEHKQIHAACLLLEGLLIQLGKDLGNKRNENYAAQKSVVQVYSLLAIKDEEIAKLKEDAVLLTADIEHKEQIILDQKTTIEAQSQVIETQNGVIKSLEDNDKQLKSYCMFFQEKLKECKNSNPEPESVNSPRVQ